MFWFDFAWDIQQLLNHAWWPINFGLLVALVTLGYLAYKKPVYAVGLTIILLPTYLFRSNIAGLPVTFLELDIWTVFCSWLTGTLVRNGFKLPVLPAQLKIYRWPIILILAGSTVAVFLGPNLFSAAGLWKAYIIEPILFLIVLKNVLTTPENKKIILWALGISTITIAWLAIYQKFSGLGIYTPAWTNPAHRRATSLFSSPNAVGLYLGPIIAIYIGWMVAEFKQYKAILLKLLIVLPALVALAFTMSQGAYLGLAAALIFMAFFGWNKKITAAVVAVIIVVAFILPQLRSAALPMITFTDASGQNRLTLWNIAATQLTANPKNFILGLGIGGFAAVQNTLRNPLKLEPLLYPHNILLNFWTELGLLGLIGFSWVVTVFFQTGFKQLLPTSYFLLPNNWLQLGVMAAMVTVVVHGLIDVPYFKNDLAVLFWVVVGLL